MQKKVDITGGPLFKSVVTFSIPLILTSLLQSLFNTADLMVVGNMGGDLAVGSVGAVSPVVSLLVTSFVGLSAGVNAVLARCFGSGNESRAKRVVNTAVIFSLVFGIILAGVCVAFSGILLEAVGCPEDCFDGAVLYLKIYALGVPAMMVYNFASAIIRTSGDSKSPLYYGIIAGIANVIFNVVFCFLLDSKPAAVAIATTVSQVLGAILTFIHLVRLKTGYRFDIRHLSFSFAELGVILKIGLPCAFNSSLFSLSNIQMHSLINSYGSIATAGNAAATNLETLVSCVSSGVIAATVPFVGQNIGADNKRRVWQSIICCWVLAAGLGFILGFGSYALRHELLRLYLPDGGEAIAYGASRMAYVARFTLISASLNVFSSALQAFGYSVLPMINSIMTVFVFRMIWVEFIYPPLDAVNHTINNVYRCYTFSWLLSFIAHGSVLLFVVIRYLKTGKTRRL